MTRPMRIKSFSLPDEILDILEQFARLPQYKTEAEVARTAIAEFFKNHKEEIDPPQ